MQTTNTQQGPRSNDIRWYLLGEYWLNELLPDPEKYDQRTVELLSTKLRQVNTPLRRIELVEMELKSFAITALRQMTPDGKVHPVQIRIFCQEKILDEENKGGWGYFVIVKPRDVSCQDDEERQGVIDLYVYEEG